MLVMTGADAYSLRVETPSLHMHTLKLAIIDPHTATRPMTYAHFRDLLRQRLPLLLPFRRRPLVSPLKFGPMLWAESGLFDMDYHLKHVKLPEPGGESELNALMSQAAGEPLSRDYPLWQIYFVEGLKDGKIAYLLKMHHALADGSATAALVMSVLNDKPTITTPIPENKYIRDLFQKEIPLSQWQQLKFVMVPIILALYKLPWYCFRSLRSLWRDFRGHHFKKFAEKPVAAFDCPPTIFNQRPSANRIVSHVDLSLSDFKHIKKTMKCTINDIFLTVVGGALHRYLEHSSSLPDQALSAVIPISVRQAGEDQACGNALSHMFLTTGSNIEDPLERLAHVSESSSLARQAFATSDKTLAKDWMDIFWIRKLIIVYVPKLVMKLTQRPACNVIVSNVPGPRKALYIDGNRVDSVRSVGPLTWQQGLNFTGWSYQDQFSIGIHASKEKVPDLDLISVFIRLELEELQTKIDAVEKRNQKAKVSRAEGTESSGCRQPLGSEKAETEPLS